MIARVMSVTVDKVVSLKKRRIRQNIRWFAACRNSPILSKDVNLVGNVFNNMQIMSGYNDGLS